MINDLSTLITPVTVDQAEIATLSVLNSLGFPATAWQVGSLPRSLVRSWARGVSDLSNTIVNIANGGYLDLAANGWLDLLVQSFWGITRIQAVATQGYVQISLSSTAPSSVTWEAGELVVEDLSRLAQYQNTSSITLAPGGSVSALLTCLTPGVIGNVGNNSITRIVSGVKAGASVNNPAYLSGTWIYVPGRDEETDVQLRDRAKAKWSTLGAGGTETALQYWALSAGAASVVKATVKRGTNGAIDVYVASTIGTVSASDLALVDAVLQYKRPLCSTVTTSSASVYTFHVGGNVTSTTAQKTTAQAAVAANVNALFQGIPMGGTIYINDVISAIMSAPGVISLDMKNISGTTYAQTANVALTSGQAATWTNALNWVV